MDRITIDSLRLNNFRNYENLHCSFNEHINVITGLNGAGKTSILDAIYYLSNGKSFFSHLDSYIYKKGDRFFNIHSSHRIGNEKYEISVLSSVEKGKQILVDDSSVKSLSEFVGRFPAFMIAPKDILILIESSVERRKLIDRTISHVDKLYLTHLLLYNKLLKLRNAALKNFLKRGHSDSLMLDAFDKKMEEPARYIYEKRSSYTTSIGPIINDYYFKLASGKENISLTYKSKLHIKSFEELMNESRQKDFLTGKTNEGIHRDDLSIFLDDLDIRKIGSQGQLKSAIIAIKIAQVEWVKSIKDIAPLILLDDIFDKLDRARVENLINICANELNAQIFISDTDANRVIDGLSEMGLEHKHLHVDNAKIISDV